MKKITLIGSTRFKQEYETQNRRLTLAGNVVLSCGVFVHSDNTPLTDGQKARLDEIHKEKIRMSEEVFVINLNGYIGKNTEELIKFTKKEEKKVHYLESPN